MKALPTGRVPPVGKNRARELARLHLSEETGGVFIGSPRAPSRGQAMRLDHGVRSVRMSANKLSLVGVLIGTMIGGLAASFFAISPLLSQDQQKTLPPPGQPLKVSIEVVNVYAVVEDKKHNLIPSLNKDDFEVTEDNTPQQIRYFSRETDTPLTMGIMVDTSPSQQR